MSVVRCLGADKHEMIEIVKGLRMCECRHHGTLQHLKGAVDEARRLVEAEGGFEAVRARLKAQAKARRKANAEDRQDRRAKYMSAGRDNGAPLSVPGVRP